MLKNKNKFFSKAKEKLLAFSKHRNQTFDEKLKYEFLPSALEISESPPSKMGERIIYGIFFILLSFLIWASVSKVDEVAVSRGKIVPNGRLKVIQTLEEGVITSILVDEGERVKKGQVLIELDSTIKKVDETAIMRDLDIANMEKVLLEKYLKGEDLSSLEKFVNSSSLNEDIKELLKEFSVSRIEHYNSKKERLTLAQTQAKEDLSAMEIELTKLEKALLIAKEKEEGLKKIKDATGVETINIDKIKANLEVLEKEVEKNRELFEAGAIPKSELEKSQHELNLMKKEYEAQGARGNLETSSDYLRWKQAFDEVQLLKKDIELQKIKVSQTKIKLEESKSNLDNLDKQNEEEALNLIVEKQKEIEHLKSSLEKAQKSIEYKSLVSPVNGVVQGISANTIGGVLSPAQSIMSIVPENTPLIIEAMVANKDIGFIHVGQKASVKIDTFSFQRYGLLEGRVEKVSPDAFEDEKYGLVYKIKVSLEKDSLKVDENIVKLSPGMSVTVEVKTGERRIIAFLFEPLVKYLHEAFSLR